MLPALFEAMYGNVDLLKLVVSVGLTESEVDSVFMDGLVQVGVVASECGSHVRFEIYGDADIIAEPAKGAGSIIIIFCGCGVNCHEVAIRNDKGSSMLMNRLKF